MAKPDSYGNETLASDGSFCLSGNFRLANNNILDCGSAVSPEGSPCSSARRRPGHGACPSVGVGGHREGPFPLTLGGAR